MDNVILDALCWIPRAWLTESEEAEVCRELTIKPRGFQGDKPEPIVTYYVDPTGRYLGTPIVYGLKRVSKWVSPAQCLQARSVGFPIQARKLPNPYHERVENPEAQAQFFADMLHELQRRLTVMAKAPTGTGKTVALLHTIGKVGLTALVIVPTKEIARQWRAETALHLGFTEDEIGTVEEGTADWQGKSVVIAVVHNLVHKQWPDEFYRYFGLVAWDECHTLGARSFSQSMYLFPAVYKVGVTATPERGDGCADIFLNYFGEPCVISIAEALACDCIVLPYRKKGGPYPPEMPKARQISCLTRDAERNELCCYGLGTLYKKGRNILAVSDRVEHLQLVMSLCFAAGIPEEEMGLFVRAWVTPEGKKKVFKSDHLEYIKQHSRIIFATYGMFKMAIDVPRLDAGMDLTPRSEGTQLIGRIRRPLPGKFRPIWMTIRDSGNILLTQMLNKRLDNFRANNVTVIENAEVQN